MTELEPFNQQQTRQLHILRVRGYQLTIVNRQRQLQRLGVAGRDPSNARIVGAIDRRGKFVGTLPDFAPSKIGVGAPPAEPTAEELTG